MSFKYDTWNNKGKLDYEDLEQKGFDHSQINQIIKAAKNNINLTELSTNVPVETMRKIIEMNPDIEDKKMRLLANCITNNFDTSYVLDCMYSYNQAAQIVDGMYKKVNYKLYAKHEYTPALMKVMKNGLRSGLDEELVKKIDMKNAKTYIDTAIVAKKDGFDMLRCVNEGYNLSQIKSLLLTCRFGPTLEELEKFITPNFSIDQIDGVRECMKDKTLNEETLKKIINENHTKKIMLKLYKLHKAGYDIDEFVDKGYTAQQINLIAVGVINGYNYHLYSDPKFSSKQMSQILNGLSSKLDASCYADFKYTHIQMKAFYMVLKANQTKEEVDINLLLHPEYGYQKILSYASKLRHGTLDEKLEIINEHDKLTKNKNIKENTIEEIR